MNILNMSHSKYIPLSKRNTHKSKPIFTQAIWIRSTQPVHRIFSCSGNLTNPSFVVLPAIHNVNNPRKYPFAQPKTTIKENSLTKCPACLWWNSLKCYTTYNTTISALLTWFYEQVCILRHSRLDNKTLIIVPFCFYVFSLKHPIPLIDVHIEPPWSLYLLLSGTPPGLSCLRSGGRENRDDSSSYAIMDDVSWFVSRALCEVGHWCSGRGEAIWNHFLLVCIREFIFYKLTFK
jgi:hypothetical protein